MGKKIAVGAVVVVLVAAGALTLWYSASRQQGERQALPLYFSYLEGEVATLAGLSSSQEITAESVYRWDEKAFELVSKNKTGAEPAAKVYAYLAVAQRDAAHLSFNAKRRFMGSIDPVSKGVVCIFFPGDCMELSVEPDAYSEAIAKMVLTNVKLRIAEDDRTTRPYEKKVGEQYWAGIEPYIAQDAGSWKPWALRSGDQFRASPPVAYGSSEDAELVLEVKNALANITEKQKRAVVFWAGGPGTKTPPGQWLKIADDHMRAEGVSADQALTVRAALTMAIADATVAVFDSKYTYWVKRPFMKDSTILTVMPTPNHPSYPAGHGTISGASVTILSHYFPAEADAWMAMGQEASNSRLWGGIHHSVDNEQGFILGTKVAEEVLRTFR